MPQQPVLYLFLYIVLGLLVFFVGREIMCWYYKINTIVSLLQETNELLRANVHVGAAGNATRRAQLARLVAEPAPVEYDAIPVVDDRDALEAATKAAMRTTRE